MTDPTELKAQIKRMLVEDLMLQITADEIGDAQPLFGPGGIGLDSVGGVRGECTGPDCGPGESEI